jgi:hypothetical protein
MAVTAVGRTSYRQSQLTERDKRLGAEVTRSSTPWLPRDKRHLLVKIAVDLTLQLDRQAFQQISLSSSRARRNFGLPRLIAQDKL